MLQLNHLWGYSMETLPTLNPTIASVIGPGAKLTGKLESVRRVIDEKFLAACELLSQSVDGIENLISSLDMLAETLDSHTVATTTEDLQMAAAKLFSLPSSHAERTVKINRLSKCREEFSERVSDMRCSLAYMRAMVSGVEKYCNKPEAEGGHRAGPMLQTFLRDISSYIERGTNELKKLEFDLSSLQLGLESVSAQGEILEFQIDQLLPMVPDDLTTNANIMGNHYLRVVSIAGSVSALAKDIHMRVTRLLSALQIGDITRQRIEHIQAGVILLDTGSKLLPPDKRDRIVDTLYALLAAQISAAAADFHREVSEVGQSMSGLGADARELMRLHDMAYGNDGETEGGFLRRISDQISRALDLVKEVEKVEMAAIDTVHDSVASAAELSQRIGAIQALKCEFPQLDIATAFTDEERSDETLTSIIFELAQYGEHLSRSADSCVTIAERLSKSALSAEHDWQTDTRKESEGAAAAKALEIAADRIYTAREKTEVDIAAIVSKGDMVLNMLEISSGRIDFHTGVGDIVDEVTSDLTKLGEMASPCQDDDTELLETVLARMAKFYSMSQEREIHRTFVAALGAGSVEPEPSQFGKDDFETILF